MLAVLEKNDYFQMFDNGLIDHARIDIKAAQDAWVRQELGNASGLRVAEAGGGNSRVLRTLKEKNECWNIDKLEGIGAGPKAGSFRQEEKIRQIYAFVGESSKEIPDNYFDVVFSISVIEHIPLHGIAPYFRDIARILKPGGLSLHAFDYYIGDEPRPSVDDNIALIIRESEAETNMRFIESPNVPRPLLFRSSYVSNSDLAMAVWNTMAPNLRNVRAACQAVTLKAAWRKIG